MNRYIGLDAHTQTCTFGVITEKGKQLKTAVVETNGESLVELVRLIPGRRHLCLEEGTQSQWLAEILSPHVHELAAELQLSATGKRLELAPHKGRRRPVRCFAFGGERREVLVERMAEHRLGGIPWTTEQEGVTMVVNTPVPG